MGQIWLFDLPDVLRAAGLWVETWPDWEARARSSGGYDDILGVQVHHTASDTTPENDMSYMWGGSPDEPVGAIFLARSGIVTVGAAGATNTSGKGGPLATSKGTIPLDAANRYVISIEAANDGVGEPWPDDQVVAYRIMSRALVDRYGLKVQPGDLHAHFEWTSRKIDPAGNSPYASGGASWNMGAFRRDVDALNPDPTPPPTGKENDMIIIDLNPGTDWWVSMMLAGDELTHLVNGHHVAVMERGGVPRVPLGTPVTSAETELEGILLSVTTTNDSPFGPTRPDGSANPSFNQHLHGLWLSAAG